MPLGGEAFASPTEEAKRFKPLDPTPAGKYVPQPCICLPFAAKAARQSIYVTNGWHNAADENGYTGLDVHAALDLELVNTPDHGYGVPLLAAADGRVYYSYQYTSEQWTDPATGTTHQIGVGAGLVIELRLGADDSSFVLQYIHPSAVAEGVPYLKPEPTDVPGDWYPAPLVQGSNADLWKLGKPVTTGEIIGWQGDSGVGFDWKDDFDPTTGTIAPRDRKAKPPWDPTQLHFQMYQGRKNGAKQNIIDPTGIYGQPRPGEWNMGHRHEYNPYGNVPGELRVGPRTAFFTDDEGRPLYAG